MHQRAQVRRQHRQDRQHHPFRLVARLDEILGQAQALGQPFEFCLRTGLGDFLAKVRHFLFQVHLLEQFVDGFRPHARIKLVPVGLDRFQEGFIGEQLFMLEPGHARVDDDEGLEIKYALDIAQGHVQQQADARRQRFQKPDVGYGTGQLDVAHALTAHLGQRDLDAALLANHPAVLETLVLAAQALIVLDRPEDLGTEQPVAFRLEGTVVDGLGLFDLAVRPGTDHVRGGQTDADGIEVDYFTLVSQQAYQVSHKIFLVP